METQRRGHEKKNGRETPPKMMETPSAPGDRACRPWVGTFPCPPLAKLDGGAPLFVWGTYCSTAVWGSRGDGRGAAAGGGRESFLCPAGLTKTECVLSIQNDVMTATTTIW